MWSVVLITALFLSSIANAQIEAVIGEEIPVDTIGVPRPQANCASVKMTEVIQEYLPADFRIENHIVYFRPSQPGVQKGSVDITWMPEPNEQHCYPTGKRFEIEAKGVVDTLVRVHPKLQNLVMQPDFDLRAYRCTFPLTLQNKIDAATTFRNWRVNGLPDSAFELSVYHNDEKITSYEAARFESNIKLNCELDLRQGPFWDPKTIHASILTDVSGPYDSVFVNEIPLRLPWISKLSIIGFAQRPRFDTIAGAIRRDTVALRLKPTVHDLSFVRLSTPGVAEPSFVNDSTMVFTMGPTPSGHYYTFGLIRWRWLNFSGLPQSDSEYYNISSIIDPLKPKPEELQWTGPIDSLPTFSVKVWKPEGMFNPRLKYGEQLIDKPEIIDGFDSVELRFESKKRVKGQYYDEYNITFDMVGPDGKPRTDFAAGRIRLFIQPSAGIPLEASQIGPQAWPNPAAATVNFERALPLPAKLLISDNSGRNMHTSTHFVKSEIDVSDWPNGIYFARIGDETLPFIVQH